MTLVETLIATGIGTVILTAVMAVSLFSARSFAGLGNYVDLDIKSRQALDLMSQEIRQVDALTSYATNQLVFSGTETNGTAYTLSYNDKQSDRSNSYPDQNGGGRHRLESAAHRLHLSEVRHVPAQPTNKHLRFVHRIQSGHLQTHPTHLGLLAGRSEGQVQQYRKRAVGKSRHSQTIIISPLKN